MCTRRKRDGVERGLRRERRGEREREREGGGGSEKRERAGREREGEEVTLVEGERDKVLKVHQHFRNDLNNLSKELEGIFACGCCTQQQTCTQRQGREMVWRDMMWGR